ncbi:transcriptional regulator [Haloarcula amylolytica]|uniref:transcriptional regulator n=1 Tax=Haloarcula amylolytica TaxID=396317 RepID=UPI003C794778
MAGDDRDDVGRYTETYPDEDFLSAVESIKVASTQNVADEVGCSYDLAYHRLKELAREGHISSREVRNAFIWVSE